MYALWYLMSVPLWGPVGFEIFSVLGVLQCGLICSVICHLNLVVVDVKWLLLVLKGKKNSCWGVEMMTRCYLAGNLTWFLKNLDTYGTSCFCSVFRLGLRSVCTLVHLLCQ